MQWESRRRGLKTGGDCEDPCIVWCTKLVAGAVERGKASVIRKRRAKRKRA